MKKPMHFRLDPGLVGRVDAARGADSRTAFVELALERLLEAHVAPSRAPVAEVKAKPVVPPLPEPVEDEVESEEDREYLAVLERRRLLGRRGGGY